LVVADGALSPGPLQLGALVIQQSAASDYAGNADKHGILDFRCHPHHPENPHHPRIITTSMLNFERLASFMTTQ